MKKIFILVGVIGIIFSANILFSNKNTNDEKLSQPLAELLNLKIQNITSFNISNGNKIMLSRPTSDSCIRIESINYCTDSTKIYLLKKFLSNNIKDLYDKTEENIRRLGFKKEIVPSIIINNEKTLFFGNLNKYNEIYVLHGNKIYKTLFYEGILETTIRFWFDKSTPLIPLTDSDEFDIIIARYSDRNLERANKSICARVNHKEIVLTTKHSALRNSFLDLYPSDVMKTEKIEVYEPYDIALMNSNTGNLIQIFSIYKEEHLTYGVFEHRDDLKFVIPNSVYKNVKSYCKK